MRVVEISKAGPPDVLVVRERPDPLPKQGEVLVDVRAAGVNFADIMGRMGLYPDAPPTPYVPGYEVAGLCEGRRVFAATRFEGYATRVAVRRDQVFPLPDRLSYEEGAAIPVNYLTAWVALVSMSRVTKGDRVLVEHGAGGVGIAALQVARHFAAEFTGVVGSAEKSEFLRARGGSAVLRGDPIEGPFEIILDPTGASTLPRDLELLTPGGRVVLYGASEFVSGPKRKLLSTAWRFVRRPKIDPYKLMYQNRGIYGLNMLTYGREGARRAMEELAPGLQEGWIQPHVGATFPLERAADAHAYLQDRKNIGKVVLTVSHGAEE